MCREKSLKICPSGRVGYLKLTCRKSMVPSTSSNVKPSSLLELIFDFRSSKANMKLAEFLALVEAEASALVWDTPRVAKTNAKNTCKVCTGCLAVCDLPIKWGTLVEHGGIKIAGKFCLFYEVLHSLTLKTPLKLDFPWLTNCAPT